MTQAVIRWKYLIALSLALAFAGMPALAVGDIFGFEPQYWDQSMTGTMRVDGNTLEGTDFDLQDTLGLPENDDLPAGRLWLHWLKRNSLIYTKAKSKRSGDQVLTSNLVFNDQTFLAGEELKSQVETDLESLLYGYNFLDFRLVKVGFRLGASRLGFDATLNSSTTPTRASSSENVTFPVAGLGVSFEPIPLLRFIADINGIGASLSGKDVTYYDARLQAEIYWAHFFGIITGYRRVRIDANLEDFGSADVNQKGPYAGFVFRF